MKRGEGLAFLVRLFLGGVFIYAGLDKIIDPAGFAKIIYNYRIVPEISINLIAVCLPWLEFILGVMLVAGIFRPGTLVLVNLLLLIFLGGLVFNLARGLDVHCGCFTTDASGDPATWLAVVRDAILLALSLGLLVKTVRRPDLTGAKVKE